MGSQCAYSRNEVRGRSRDRLDVDRNVSAGRTVSRKQTEMS